MPLDRPVPVYITYLTAAPTEKGLVFREDAERARQLATTFSPD